MALEYFACLHDANAAARAWRSRARRSRARQSRARRSRARWSRARRSPWSRARCSSVSLEDGARRVQPRIEQPAPSPPECHRAWAAYCCCPHPSQIIGGSIQDIGPAATPRIISTGRKFDACISCHTLWVRLLQSCFRHSEDNVSCTVQGPGHFVTLGTRFAVS